jgi:hypothetical protein
VAVTEPGRWLWRTTWRDGVTYGVSYATPRGQPRSQLLKSADGAHFDVVQPRLLGKGRPTEARIRFASDGSALCLHRRDGEGEANSAFLGTAQPPYDVWEWKDLGAYFGGPNLLQIPGGAWIGAGRMLDGGARTKLAFIDSEAMTLKPILALPSGGDTSYPGMVWHDDKLWVSYYSSHEGKTSIYLATIKVK